MSTYFHKCLYCKAKREVDYPMACVGDEQKIDTSVLISISCTQITCKKKVPPEPGSIWPRIPYATHIANQSEGTTVSEKDLLKRKQKQRKLRSRLHFKNDILHTLSKQDQRMFKGKYDHLKGDHEKM